MGNTCCACAKPTKDSDFTVTNQTPPEVQDPSPKKVDFANGESEIVVALGHEASNAIQHPPLFENQVQARNCQHLEKWTKMD